MPLFCCFTGQQDIERDSPVSLGPKPSTLPEHIQVVKSVRASEPWNCSSKASVDRTDAGTLSGAASDSGSFVENVEQQQQLADGCAVATASVRPVSKAKLSLSSGPNSAFTSMQLPLSPQHVTLSLPEDLLGDVIIKHCLGQGAFAPVFHGIWQGAEVAVKIMVTENLDNTVLKEAVISPKLAHPNVVHTYLSRCAELDLEYVARLYEEQYLHRQDSGDSEFVSGEGFGPPIRSGEAIFTLESILKHLRARPGQHVTVVVMEFCDKTTLHHAIYKGLFTPGVAWDGRAAKRAMLRTLAEIAHGMIHLHSSGVLHGDLKPANVLLKSSRVDRRGFTAKIADFGLAHLLHDKCTSLSTTTWGTVAYMAPEYFQERIGRAADVFSFGVLMWEMVARDRPYNGLSQAQVTMGVLDGSLRLIWPVDADPDIVGLGQLCLARDPKLRPTFQELEKMIVNIEAAFRAELKQQSFERRSSKSGYYKSSRRQSSENGTRV